MASSDIVLRLIENSRKSENSFLDLGNYGLTDSSPELELLANLPYLEAINLGTYYYLNGREQYSAATAAPNQFTGIPAILPPGIKELYLNQTGLQSLTGLNQYTTLLYFDGFGNAVHSLDGLQPNTKLYSLGLSSNAISDVSLLQSLFPNLRFLYLGKNKISRIKEQFSWNLPLLEELYLYENQIKEISFLRNNKSIRKLYLRANQIKDASPLSNLSWLEEVDLEQNPVAKNIENNVLISRNAPLIRSRLIRQTLASLLIEDCSRKKDSFLDLGNCGLTGQFEELQKLSDLEQVTSMSLGDGYFDDKDAFILSANKGAPNSFPSLSPYAISRSLPKQLEELQIRNAGLQHIPLPGERLSHLRLLDVSGNLINRIDNINGFSQLTELALHGNPVTSLAKAVLPASLTTLHISNMQLTELQGIEQCQQLETLIAYGNRLTAIRPLLQLPNLKSINLDGNSAITDCPVEIWGSNDIVQIRNYFREMDSQQNGEKPLQASPQPVRTNEESTNVINDVKLIILGNSNAGKTFLTHYLQYGTYPDIRNSTHGLEVKRWQPDTTRFPQLTNVEVSIWDFGGQEYYHDAYKLFLGSNAVYVVLWDEDSDKNIQRPELVKDGEPEVLVDHFEKHYWLDTVKSFRGDAASTPLLLVQNKVDDLATQKKRVSQDIHEEYKINESFHISLREGCNSGNAAQVKNLLNFTAYLADCLSALAYKNAQFSEDFKFIRKEVLNLSLPGEPSVFGNENDLYIHKTDFLYRCREEVAKRKTSEINNDPEHYPEWLHNGGVLLYFKNNPLLKDQVFINPSKLSEEIYTILSKEVLANKGEIANKEVVNKEEADKRILIINVMQSLEMLYPHPAREKFLLAPQYLPEQHPIEDLFKIASVNAWDDSYWVKVPLFFYKKLLNFLLLRFIATPAGSISGSSQAVIKNTDFTVLGFTAAENRNSQTTVADTATALPDARYFWKNGILLLKNGKRILIKGLRSADNDGMVQVSVEDNDAGLQKWVFDTILSFNLWQNRLIQSSNPAEAVSTGVNREPTITEKQFLEKLQLSIDQVKYYSYNYLKTAADQSGSSPDNITIPFRHIIPLKVPGPQPKNVFVSYSHSNTVWLAKLRNHLAGLRRSNLIKDWTDQELLAGENWDLRIKEQMKKADVFILLISAEFISSEYIWKQELKDAFASKKTIIPVYIESCDLAALPNIDGETNSKINDFEIIPKYENKLLPVNLWRNEAEALTTVAERIRKTILELR